MFFNIYNADLKAKTKDFGHKPTVRVYQKWMEVLGGCENWLKTLGIWRIKHESDEGGKRLVVHFEC